MRRTRPEAGGDGGENLCDQPVEVSVGGRRHSEVVLEEIMS